MTEGLMTAETVDAAAGVGMDGTFPTAQSTAAFPSDGAAPPVVSSPAGSVSLGAPVPATQLPDEANTAPRCEVLPVPHQAQTVSLPATADCLNTSVILPLPTAGIAPDPLAGFGLPKAVTEVFHADNFPFYDLGPLITGVGMEVSEHFNVPKDLIVLAMLSIAGGLYGRPARQETGMALGAANLFCICAASPASAAAAALDHLVAPVRQIQEVMARDFRNLDHKEPRAELQKLTKECRAFSAKVGETNPARQAMEKQLASLEAAHHSSILLEGLRHQETMLALRSSIDGALLHFSTDGGSVKAIRRGARDRDKSLGLVSRLVGRQPIQHVSKNGRADYWAAPSLSGFSLITPAELAGFLAESEQLPTGLQQGLICLESKAKPCRVDITAAKPEAVAWQSRLQLLAQARQSGDWPDLVCSPGASIYLRDFYNFIVELLPGAPPELHAWLMVWPGLACRICAAIQLLQESPHVPANRALAEAAVALARWYGGRHLAAWLFARQQPAQEIGCEVEVSAVLARIRFRGPLTRRDLCRTFKRQRAALYEPAIEQLLAGGQVVEDELGRLLAQPEEVTVSIGSSVCQPPGLPSPVLPSGPAT